MTLGAKIRHHRKLLGLTQTELGLRLGVKTNAVSKWECGRVEDIPTSKIKAMALLFGVPASYLIDPDTAPTPLPEGAVPLDEAHFHRIPILGRISAGLPLFAEEHVDGYTYTELNGGAEYFALRVRGESMLNAGILPGDLVVVRQTQSVRNGEIVVALIEDEATVKTYSKLNGHVWLLPENDAYEPIDGTYAQILGKVAAVVRRY